MSARFPDLGFDPAPGDPGEVHHLARDASRVATEVGELAEQLELLVRADVTWQGVAADSFTEAVVELPRQLREAHSAFGAAGRALARWADTLVDLQSQARRAEQDAGVAQHRLRAAQLAAAALPPLPLLPDPMTFTAHLAARGRASAAVASAEAELEVARTRGRHLSDLAEEAARTAERAVGAAARHAPTALGLWQRFTDWSGEALRGLDQKLEVWVREHREEISRLADACSVLAAAAALVPGLGSGVALLLGGVALGAQGALLAYADGTPEDVWLAAAGVATGGLARGVGRIAAHVRAAETATPMGKLPSMFTRGLEVGDRELRWRTVQLQLDLAGHAQSTYGVAGIGQRRFGQAAPTGTSGGPRRLDASTPGWTGDLRPVPPVGSPTDLAARVP